MPGGTSARSHRRSQPSRLYSSRCPWRGHSTRGRKWRRCRRRCRCNARRSAYPAGSGRGLLGHVLTELVNNLAVSYGKEYLEGLMLRQRVSRHFRDTKLAGLLAGTQRRRRRLTALRSPPQMRWADASACQPCAGPHTRASSTTDTAGRLASSPSTAAMPLPSASPKPRTPGDCHSQTSSSILPS